ncbi:ribosome-associated translation inhibitor RaiA [Paenibacillus jamilae]|nr:ribosome-associated translation inhibitor RaiA [Paenibacillus jamilae]
MDYFKELERTLGKLENKRREEREEERRKEEFIHSIINSLHVLKRESESTSVNFTADYSTESKGITIYFTVNNEKITVSLDEILRDYNEDDDRDLKEVLMCIVINKLRTNSNV